jgi:hypothetical protein
MAAVRGFLLFQTADGETFGDVVHWSTVLDLARKGGKVADDVSLAAYREKTLGNIQKQVDRAAVEALLLACLDHFTTEKLESGSSAVAFPDPWKGLVFEVREIGGIWYLVSLP